MAKRKIIAAGAALAALIIVAAFSVMSIVQSKTVADVEKPQLTARSESSASFKWKKVSGADGYYIYSAKTGDKEFERSATINDGNTHEYTLKNLEQGTPYDFYISAFKKSNAGVESKEHQTLSTCTKPKKQIIGKMESTDPGVMSVEWEINPNASGYQFQFVQGDGKSFEKAKTVNISDKAVGEYKAQKLPAERVYAARVRTFRNYKNAPIYGEWSDVKKVKIAKKIEAASGIDPKKPMIALTFDDGPGYNDASDKILDVLEKYNVRATFFMVGQNAKDHPDNLKRKVKLKCELGNHTWNHDHYGKNVTKADIKKASDAIKKASGGVAPDAFRSPGGNTTKVIRDECTSEGMPLYYWSLDTEDWKSRNADSVYNAVMKNVKDGDIILMHEIYGSTADAVGRMVPQLIKQGYQLVTVRELVIAKTGKEPVAGQQYVTATDIKDNTH